MVKNKWALALVSFEYFSISSYLLKLLFLAAFFTVFATLSSTAGICSYFELTPTLWGVGLYPYLAMVVGLENILCITRLKFFQNINVFKYFFYFTGNIVHSSNVASYIPLFLRNVSQDFRNHFLLSSDEFDVLLAFELVGEINGILGEKRGRSTWKEQTKFSSTCIIAAALSNCPTQKQIETIGWDQCVVKIEMKVSRKKVRMYNTG